MRTKRESQAERAVWCGPLMAVAKKRQETLPQSSAPEVQNAKTSLKKKVKLLSRVQLYGTPWTVVYQAPRSMDFSRQEYWRGLPFPSPGDLPNPGIKPRSPALQVDSLQMGYQGSPHKA